MFEQIFKSPSLLVRQETYTKMLDNENGDTRFEKCWDVVCQEVLKSKNWRESCKDLCQKLTLSECVENILSNYAREINLLLLLDYAYKRLGIKLFYYNKTLEIINLRDRDDGHEGNYIITYLLTKWKNTKTFSDESNNIIVEVVQIFIAMAATKLRSSLIQQRAQKGYIQKLEKEGLLQTYLTGFIDPKEKTIEIPRLGVTLNEEVKIKYWDCDPNAEELRFTEQDDAIVEELENGNWKEAKSEDIIVLNGQKYPRTVEVYGFAPFEIDLKACKNAKILESFLEWLDEQYKYEDTEDPTPKMRKAEEDFIKEVVSEYNVTMAKQVPEATVEVDTHKWIIKNRPYWLEQ